jgi:non-heme chloroperoxidase
MVRSIALPTGVTLQYVERGQQSGAPIVFLHGVTDSWRSFEPVLEHLPATVRSFAVTLRGHGGSSRPTSGYRYADMSEDVRAFMDALNLPAAVVVGHSMGSMVAQRFAIDHPRRVSGLVLMGSFATLHGHKGVEEFWTSTVSKLTDPIEPAFARDFQESTLARQIPPHWLDTFAYESLTVPAEIWKALFKGFVETPSFSHELAAVTAPTLIAWGDRDAYASRADQEALRRALPHARLLVYAGGGHAFHWEDPARFAADLVSFIYERPLV